MDKHTKIMLMNWGNVTRLGQGHSLTVSGGQKEQWHFTLNWASLNNIMKGQKGQKRSANAFGPLMSHWVISWDTFWKHYVLKHSGMWYTRYTKIAIMPIGLNKNHDLALGLPAHRRLPLQICYTLRKCVLTIGCVLTWWARRVLIFVADSALFTCLSWITHERFALGIPNFATSRIDVSTYTQTTINTPIHCTNPSIHRK